MSFSIIIPSKNIDNLRACVSAIRRSGETAQVVVVWDGVEGTKKASSMAELFAIQRQLDAIPGNIDDCGCARAMVVNGRRPFCFAANVNVGIDFAGTDDVVLLNDDCLVIPHAGSMPLTRLMRSSHGIVNRAGDPLLRRIASDDQFGIVSPRVMAPAALQHSYPDGGVLGERCFTFATEEMTDVTDFRMLPFVCVAIKRSVINAVGLLDERFCGFTPSKCETCGIALLNHEAPVGGLMRATCVECGVSRALEPVYGGEDDDYCYRVRKAGLRLGVLNTWVADHKTLQSTFRPDGKGRSVAGARQRFYEIHGFAMGTR